MAAPAPPDVVAVFVAGTLTILTPCCLPVVPPLLAGGVGHPLRPLSIVSGSVLTFTTLGVLTGVVGGLTPESLRLPFVALMIGFGAVMADDDLHEAYSRRASGLAGRATAVTDRVDETRRPLASGFLLGLLLGVVWLPCVGPILGGVLAYVGTTGDVVRSGWLLFVYGVGFGIPLLVVAYGGKRVGRGLLDATTHGSRPVTLRRLAGYVLVLTGVAMLFGLDKLVQSALV